MIQVPQVLVSCVVCSMVTGLLLELLHTKGAALHHMNIPQY